MRYKALPGNRFDHQRRKVISDFPRLADVKRQNRGPSRPHSDQTETYAGEKLSSSYSISHTLNLLFQGKSKDAFVEFKEFTQPAR